MPECPKQTTSYRRYLFGERLRVTGVTCLANDYELQALPVWRTTTSYRRYLFGERLRVTGVTCLANDYELQALPVWRTPAVQSDLVR